MISSKLRMISAINGDAAGFIASYADGPALVDLVVALHDLAAGLRYIGRKGEQKVFVTRC